MTISPAGIGLDCPSADRLEALIVGTLAEGERAAVETHLGDCPLCQSALDSVGGAAAEWESWQRLLVRPRAAAETVRSGVPGGSGPASADVLAEVGRLLEPDGAGALGRFGPYRIKRILGSGGMGIVFQAEDPQLKRDLALKVLRPALLVHSSARQRFLREAQAMAAVEHENIVPVYQVGEVNGLPFLSMPMLHGQSLGDILGAGSGLAADEVLRLGRQIAEGLAAAHGRGLIHRDIKPANIFVAGKVKVLDFGLARAHNDDVHLTGREMVGTPVYMAPEQACGDDVDARCDLFSLGCVLYQMCTGRVPLKRRTVLAQLAALAQETPQPVEHLAPGLPPRLAGLIMQLLEKDPARRPQSAQDVARVLADIERSPQDEVPSQRRRVPTRRAYLLVAASLLMLIGGGIALAQILIRVQTPDGKVTEIEVPLGANVNINEKGEVNITLSGSFLDKLKRGDISPYELTVAGDGDPAKAPKELAALLGDSRLNHWGPIHAVDFSAYDNLLVSAAADGIRIWDATTFEQARWQRQPKRTTSESVSLTPDGKQIVGSDYVEGRWQVGFWDVASGQQLRRLGAFRGSLQSFAVSPDSRMLAVHVATMTENAVELWDLGTEKRLRTLQAGKPARMEFTADGKLLLTSRYAEPALWDVATGELVRKLRTEIHVPTCATLTNDGKLVVTAARLKQGAEVVVWEPHSGARQRSFVIPEEHLRWCIHLSRVAMSPDGRTIAVSSVQGHLVLCDGETGKVLQALQATGCVYGLSFNRDGTKIAAGTLEGAIQLWDVRSGKDLRREKLGDITHIGYCRMAATPDGRYLFCGSQVLGLQMWDLSTAAPRMRKVTDTLANDVALDWTSRLLATASGKSLSTLWSVLGAGASLQLHSRQTIPAATHVALSKNGNWMATSLDEDIEIWDLRIGAKKRCSGHKEPIALLEFNPSGDLLASLSRSTTQDAMLRLWDVATGKELWARHDEILSAVAFSPDGKRLALGGRDIVYLLDVPTWKLHAQWPGHGTEYVRSIAFPPDGKEMAVANAAGTIGIWDVDTRVLKQRFRAGPIYVPTWQISYAPDGRHLLSANRNGTIGVFRLGAANPP